MRIATWNLERGGRTQGARAAQEEMLREVGADIFILTEPPASYRTGPHIVASPALRTGPGGPESWVAIVGPSVEPVTLETAYSTLAMGARALVEGMKVVVYGAVLPWLAVRAHEPALVQNGESFLDAFCRVLEAQKAELLRLRSEADLLVWAGDFNQSLVGPVHGSSEKGRSALAQCLAELGLVAWNADAPHAMPELRAVDLICGPTDRPILGQGRIDPDRNGTKMSDHAGYWVDI